MSSSAPNPVCLSLAFSRIAVFVWLLVVTVVRQATPEQSFVGIIAGATGLWCSAWSFWRPRWALYRYLVLAAWLAFCTLAMRGPDAFVSASHAASALGIGAFSILEAFDGRLSHRTVDS
jgi:hypothetical protein